MINYIHVKAIRNDCSEFIYSKSNDRGRDRLVVRISIRARSTLCDKVCQ